MSKKNKSPGKEIDFNPLIFVPAMMMIPFVEANEKVAQSLVLRAVMHNIANLVYGGEVNIYIYIVSQPPC